MTNRTTKTGEYAIVRGCVEAILGYFESAFFMGFSDVNVWYAMASDGVPVDPDTPEEIYKVDTADLVTCIHYLVDHRRRLVGALQVFRDGLEAGDLEPWAAKTLLLDVIDAALENRPGPFENGAGAQQGLPGMEGTEHG